MKLLDKFIDVLKLQAEENEDRAYRILGARPGPGLDLEIRPVEPLCGKWYVYGLTISGRAFITKFWIDQPLQNNHKLRQLKKEATDWGLTFTTIFSPVSLTKEP